LPKAGVALGGLSLHMGTVTICDRSE